MEHLCYKCQASIDETLPFCPHCGAPQIRVASPQEESAAQVPLPGNNVPQVTPGAWIPGTQSYQPDAIQWEFAWKGALLAGLIAAMLSATPFVGFGCFLWLLGSGALSVWLYQRRVPGALVTTGMGIRIGALTGVFAFVAYAFWMVFVFTKDSQKMRTAMMEQVEKSIASNSDPRAQEILRQFMNNLNTPQGLATFFVLVMILLAMLFIIFGTAGGALGPSFFGRRR